MASEYILTIGKEEEGIRADKFISGKLPFLSRSLLQMLIENAGVTVNGFPVKKNYKVRFRDTIIVRVQEPEPMETKPQNIDLDIVYEDDDLLVVNKSRGMVVHPAAGNYSDTLVNALLYHCGDSLSGINGIIRPGIVHRIDKNTSGLLIVAKNDYAHNRLAGQIKEHSFKRQYLAVTEGNLKNEKGTVDLPLGRSPKNRKKQAVNGLHSRRAVTHYEVLERFDGYDLIRCTLETGRTHQIRVHMYALGHPVAGDVDYGARKSQILGGQCLHAAVIGFEHPRTGEYMEFSSPVPEYFSEFVSRLKKKE